MDYLNLFISVISGGVVIIYIRNTLKRRSGDIDVDLLEKATISVSYTVRELATAIRYTISIIVEAMISVIKDLIDIQVNIFEGITNHRWEKNCVIEVRHDPPKRMQLLLRFALKPKDQAAILGDMEEIFHSMVVRYGYKTARRWYVWHALRSSVSQLVEKVAKWGVVAYIGETIRRIIAP
tara:strand:+ start:337 stop:876 length:540 start_codon:yes stop_codon:yes gene_type:complete